MDTITVDSQKLLSVLRFDGANPLLFNTGLFLLLFVAFLAIYRLLQSRRKLRMVFVILFSLYFYYKSSAEYCFILLGVCIFDFLLGSWMGRATKRWQRRLIVWINVLVNIGMLAWFKYFNLLYETVAEFASMKFDALDIVLPAGISFFTFRSISYIVDLYRGQMEPCKSFLNYTFYLTFFPPLLAGPVVRAKDMLPQVEQNPVATRAMTGEGLFLIIAGLIKKVVVADFISGNFVDRIFDNPALYSGFENLMGIYGFAIQLYCDFSGYSDMAIGIALLLGFRFKDNFRSPFKSQNPTEFWRRWHISLSLWLRDYVYIPMGGNRCSKPRAWFNQFSTMAIGGLWHGASWMYLIWGSLHGLLLVGHKAAKAVLPPLAPHKRNDWWRVAMNVFVTFNLVALVFVFFRMRSLEGVAQMYHQITHDFHLGVAPQFIAGYIGVILALFLGYFMHLTPTRWSTSMRNRFIAWPLIVQSLILALVILIVIQVRQSDVVPFIYLQY